MATFLMLFLLGCVEDVGTDKIKAQVENVKNKAADAADKAQEGANKAVDGVKDGAGKAGDLAKDGMELAKDGAGKAGDLAKDGADAAIGTAKSIAAKITPAPMGAWKMDTSKSKLGAMTAKVSAKHPLEFPKWEGYAVVDGKDLSKLYFAVHMKDLTSDNERLTKHLLGEDFFHVSKYPLATFNMTEAKAARDDKGNTHLVKGELHIHGQTKVVTFPAMINVGESDVTAKTEFVIDRQDFGVNYKGKADDLIQDNVVLNISFVANK